MGSILGDPAVVRKPRSSRQLDYFNSKKTDRKVEKKEEQLQIDICGWIKSTFPDVHFRSDTGSGAFNSNYAKNTHNKQQSAKGLPDLTIFAARRGYHALCIELKTEDAKLKRKRDATKQWVRKKNGRIVERDHKLLRVKGDWYDPHIERQHQRQLELREAGYCAVFGVGEEHIKKILCWYFDIPYVEQASIF
jgi:hypothetical protein